MAVNRKAPVTGTAGWVRLGELLQERRERELDPRWYNRDAFAAETGVNLRLAQEIERNKRENITPVMLRDVIAPGYQVTFESVEAVRDEVPGADLEAAPGSPPRRLRAATPGPGATRGPAAPAGFVSDEMIASARPHADEIWQRLRDLALRGIADPSGAELFGDSDDDAADWDRYGRRGLPVLERVWLIAALRAREVAARDREASGLAASSQVKRTDSRLSPVRHVLPQRARVTTG